MNAARTEIVAYTYIQPRTGSVYVCYFLGTELVLKKGHCDETRILPQRDRQMYT